ncbi:MAG: thrombospondin type 3 repeat-containing protein [Candidatus Zixiibacteriota bacterium]
MRKKLCIILSIMLFSAFFGPSLMADWNPEDGHKMHYPQLPDEEGWNVNASYPLVLADDWMCSETGPVNEIHFWGSWREGNTGEIAGFMIRIYSDIPADPPMIEYSRPGALLWERFVEWPDIIARSIVPDPPLAEGWYDPMTGIWVYPDHYEYWQYNLMNIIEPFIQEQGNIYWLSISAQVIENVSLPVWGWKSSLNHWNDDAVFGELGAYDWEELYEPNSGYLYIPGDVNNDGIVDMNDVLYLQAFLYSGGPPPPFYVPIPPYYPAADVNGDCIVDGADLIYLTNWVNGTGPALVYCQDTPPGEPISLDLSFVINASEEELGACCYQDGTCANLSSANCIASGGTWQGAGTVCLGDNDGNGTDDACEGTQPTGACCYPDGTCAVVDQNTCLQFSGIWQGAGSACMGDFNGNLIDDACEGLYTTGACCFPDGSCITTSLGACTLAGGQYKGDGTLCLGDGNLNGIDDACEIEIDPCDYYKSPYLDYTPNGMPDFDQKQGTWFFGQPPATQWSHCGPVALANCLWWFDSKYEPSPVDPRPFYPGPGNPPTNDNYPMLQSFEPTGGLWDDHDTNNVIPFVDSLAVLAQTNIGGSGTNIWNLANAAQVWTNTQGLGQKYIIKVYALDEVEANYEFIRHEIMSSEDVILLLGFWEEIEPGFCERIGGHYVTCAGVCTAPPESALCISDPYYDANEGEPPAGSAHWSTLHNDAWYISGPHGTIDHDKYRVAPMTGCSWFQPPFFSLELPNYPTSAISLAQFAGQNLYDPSQTPVPPMGGIVHTIIEYALVICPDHDEDGIHDGIDNCPNIYNPDQTDTDGDGQGDACDPDDDNDGVLDGVDSAPLDPTLCEDVDSDGCDDCAIGTDGFGPLPDNDPNNDGLDTDADGLCDVGDPDDDNDGVLDGVDSAPLDPTLCEDVDSDGCDDCAVGTDGFGPLPDNDPNNDGADTDSDGICDLTDNCIDDYNPLQEDSDGDGIGDSCEVDCDCIPGEANGTPPYNILDITYLIAYLYKSGPAPNPYAMCSGDANCNCTVNILDITYLIAYLYKSGPAPCDCPTWLSTCGPPLYK